MFANPASTASRFIFTAVFVVATITFTTLYLVLLSATVTFHGVDIGDMIESEVSPIVKTKIRPN
jgi:hypothetical protein